MSFYLLLYIFIIFFSIFVWRLFYNKYTNFWGFSLFLFTFSVSTWFLFYFLSYYTTPNPDYILFYIKMMYFISIIWIYSLLFFILYYNKRSENLLNKKVLNIFLVYLMLWIIYLKTPLIITWVEYIQEKWDYYEVFWKFVFIHVILSLWFIPLFIYFTYIKFKTLNYINKSRLKYILLWAYIFVLFTFLFQLILPLFWIYIFEKEAVLFILPFLLLTWYSITRYHFTDLSFRYKELYSFLLSIFFTIILFFIIKDFSLSLSNNFVNYWWINKKLTYIDLIIWIIFYISFYKLFYYILPWNAEYIKFINILNKWKENIPFITNLYDLNKYLLKESNNKFFIKYIKITLFSESDNEKEIYKFFSNNIKNDIFINDIVFIEENKDKFDIINMINCFDSKAYIIFPIINSAWKLIWILEIWKKPFKENFYIEEVKIIKEFIKFLIWHIKYMEIYAKINYLNLNLDKEVDKKTMEYNNLINKQKEFISMASHEIKTPVTASYMQIESLIDDFNSWDYDKSYLDEELLILKEQIFKVADLVKNIFTVQQYEIKDIWLYIEKVKFKNIIVWEYDILSRIYPLIYFDIDISNDLWFVEIDKIQFIQVISNLLNNSIKFLNNDKPRIRITSKLLWENIELVIEDNWPGFEHWDEKDIFEKYSTWKWKSVWIWMWLYLCKKIVELHWWTIIAKNSKELWWAKFKIIIPRNYKINN